MKTHSIFPETPIFAGILNIEHYSYVKTQEKVSYDAKIWFIMFLRSLLTNFEVTDASFGLVYIDLPLSKNLV